MVQTTRRIFLVLGALLTATSGEAAEPRGGQKALEPTPQARRALAESIPRREVELALRQRGEVVAEVEKRMAEMGVRASADELTGLLEQRAHLEISLDKCRLGGGGARGCRGLEAALSAVETSFLAQAGLSTAEFRSGVRETGRGALQALLTGLRSATAAASTDTCTCAFTVYSSERWMNRYWGLECNNHASHGFCSNNVDSAHSAGTGAMTGDVDLYYGSYHANRDCPDDHYTCFRGPSTDHPGAWGNACNCDTAHSQLWNPALQWYGGDLTDNVEVAQLSTGWMSAAGACNETYVAVKEYIKENDPWCCDDTMGDLWAYLPLADGYGSASAPASAQNCNGGSQSGRYPYCGSFGATIRVAYSCATYTPPPPPVCDPEGWAQQSCSDQGWPYQWDSTACECRCQGSPSICA